MTEPTTPRPVRTTLRLAAVLSALLILAWIAFVVFAPSPSPTAPLPTPEAQR